ncbi:hypothetical protein HPB47_024901 [Ixodes persulcatus]|uniref:Uncharacterized protein n=1 Tax=Ixodes persulcatus TaxID=34615 RepID=A0AC60Q373_IXOPE|nr:hypothetical protein HPB47_024901 [Ixodes persulcatus]
MSVRCKAVHPSDSSRFVYFISDVPHLVKCVRNQMMKTGFNTQNGRVHWEHVVATWKCDRSDVTLKSAYKLTRAHVFPNGFEKMRVDLAFQVFSPLMLRAFMVHQKEVEQHYPNLKVTYAFVAFMVDFIRVMTSRFLARALRPGKAQEHVIDTVLAYLDDWERHANGRGFQSRSTSEGLRATLPKHQGAACISDACGEMALAVAVGEMKLHAVRAGEEAMAVTGARARLVYEVRGKVTAAAKKSAVGACEQRREEWTVGLRGESSLALDNLGCGEPFGRKEQSGGSRGDGRITDGYDTILLVRIADVGPYLVEPLAGSSRTPCVTVAWTLTYVTDGTAVVRAANPIPCPIIMPRGTAFGRETPFRDMVMSTAATQAPNDGLGEVRIGSKLLSEERQQAVELFFSLPDNPTQSDADGDSSSDEDVIPELAPVENTVAERDENAAGPSTGATSKKRKSYERKKPKKRRRRTLEVDSFAEAQHEEDEVDATGSLWCTDLPTEIVKDPPDRDPRYSEKLTEASGAKTRPFPLLLLSSSRRTRLQQHNGSVEKLPLDPPALFAPQRKFDLLEVNASCQTSDAGTQFVIVDMKVLNDLFAHARCGSCGAGALMLSKAVDKEYGLAVKLVPVCSTCNFQKKQFSSPRVAGTAKITPFEVNIRAMKGIQSIGKGVTALADFCACMNVSHRGLHQKTYQGHLKTFVPACENAATDSETDSVAVVKEL